MQAHKRQVHLCVAIVKYKTKLKIPRKGVCTTYLSNLGQGVLVIGDIYVVHLTGFC
jgi:sulfite reductase alpha subunit-like flavoprotein